MSFRYILLALGIAALVLSQSEAKGIKDKRKGSSIPTPSRTHQTSAQNVKLDQPDPQDHQVNLEQMALQAQQVLLDPMVCLESTESMVLLESLDLPVLLARLANQELTDLSDLQALLELREPMV